MGFQVLGTCGGASVAVRRHLLRSSTVLGQHHDKRYAAILCRADFHKEVMGHASLVFGSLHINNVAAKKPVVSAELLAEFFEAATLHKADAVGWDANQAQTRLVTLAPRDSLFLLTAEALDCVGIFIPSWSAMARETAKLRSARYYNAAQIDLGLRQTDADSHYLIAGIWHRAGVARVRNPVTKREARKRQEEAAKKRARDAKDKSIAPSAKVSTCLVTDITYSDTTQQHRRLVPSPPSFSSPPYNIVYRTALVWHADRGGEAVTQHNRSQDPTQPLRQVMLVVAARARFV